MLGDQKWHDRVDRVVERAADRISKELEKMVGALHQDAAPQMAMELLGRRLIGRSPGQQCREPGAVFGAVDLGIADHG